MAEANLQKVSPWNDPLARRVKEEFEKLCFNQSSEMTEWLATKFMKESVATGLIVIQQTQYGKEVLFSDPGRIPDEVGKFYHRETREEDSGTANGARVLTRHQVKQAGMVPQVVQENGDYGVRMIRDEEGLDR